MGLDLLSGLVGIAGGLKDLTSKGPQSIRSQIDERVGGSVKAGKKYGIHPLEILRSGTAHATQALPRLGSHTALSQGFDKLDDVLSGRQAQRDKLVEAQIKLAEAQANRLAAPSTGRVGLRKGVQDLVHDYTNGGNMQTNKVPRLRPHPDNMERITMFSSDGRELSVLKTTAERMGYKPFDVLQAGEEAELYGEFVEVANALKIDTIADTQSRDVLVGPNPQEQAVNPQTLELSATEIAGTIGRAITRWEAEKLQSGRVVVINGQRYKLKKGN